MDARQTKNKEIVTKITELMQQLDTEHPDAVVLLANLGDDSEGDGSTAAGCICAVGCRHGMAAGFYAAMAQEEDLRDAMKMARKKYKAVGDRHTHVTERRSNKFDENGVPKNPVPEGHPLFDLFETMRKATIEKKEENKERESKWEQRKADMAKAKEQKETPATEQSN